MVSTFIMHTLKFLGVLSAWFLLSGLFNFVAPRTLFDGCPNVEALCEIGHISVLIAGDSHPQRALNPAYWPDSANIAQEAEPYILTYWKLKKLLPVVRPDTVILGFSPHNLSTFNDHKFYDENWGSEIIRRSLPIATNDVELPRINLMTASEVLFFETMLYPRLVEDYWVGGYNNTNESDLSTTKEAIKRHFSIDNTPAKLSNHSLEVLKALIALVDTYDVQLILVSTPVHNTYSELIPQAFHSDFERETTVLDRSGVQIIDESDFSLADSLFLNADHLNEYGAREFTTYLRSHLGNTPP